MIRLLSLAGVLLLSTASIGTAEDAAKVEIGEQAPDFVMTGIDGQDFKLSERFGKDKHVVLMFSRAFW